MKYSYIQTIDFTCEEKQLKCIRDHIAHACDMIGHLGASNVTMQPVQPGSAGVPSQLQEAYAEVVALKDADLWSSHQVFTRGAWQDEVAVGDTQLSYWEWVEHALESACDDWLADRGSESTFRDWLKEEYSHDSTTET